MKFEEWKELMRQQWKELVQKRREGMTHSEIHNHESQLGVLSQYDPEYGQTYTITYNVTGNFDASNLPTEIKSTRTLKLNIPIPYGATGGVDANVAHTYKNGVLTIQDVQQDIEIAINVGDVLYENAKLGDYLYSDWTFGPTQKAGYLGRCVGLATENEGKSIWCSPKTTSNIKWSTELIDTGLDNSNSPIEDFNGKTNTELLLSLGADKYPAAAWASEQFQENGYLPAYGELWKYHKGISKYAGGDQVYLWSSTELNANSAKIIVPNRKYNDPSDWNGVKTDWSRPNTYIGYYAVAFCQLSGKPGNPKYNGHEYVEIGGLKWATMNVGATSETDAGLYFQWGDTQGYTAEQVGSGEGKKNFFWADYKYGNGTSSPGPTDMTKYNATDGLTTLEASDDAARVNWGGDWRMPTSDEFQELGQAVNTEYVTNYNGTNVNGLLCTDKTDSSKKLFFPAAGFASGGGIYQVGNENYVWSSSLNSNNMFSAWELYFYNGGVYFGTNTGNRYQGRSIRGVIS